MQDAAADALARERFRCGTDFYQDHQRAIFQFPVMPELYDHFFNSRTGYRAQYWIAPEQGQDANAEFVRAVCRAISAALPDRFAAREIKTEDDWTGRKDWDVGDRKILRSFFMESFAHPAAKIYICERLILGQIGPLQSVSLDDAPRLVVEGWTTARALCPDPLTLLDVKGGFVGGEQPKDPWGRALQLHRHGYS